MDYQETFGAQIRQFFRELLGSRLVERLEIDLLNLRNDMDRQLHDCDLLIATLREEKQLLQSKITAYEFAVLPRTSRAGAEVIAYQKPAPPKPNFNFADIPPTKSRWELFQENYYKGEAEKEAAEKAAEVEKKAQKESEAATAAV